MEPNFTFRPQPRTLPLPSYASQISYTRILPMNDLILYTTDDGRSQIKLRAKDQTVWLSQREMAQLFDVSTDNVGLHLKNIYEDGELSRDATTEDSSVVQIEGGREVQRPVTLHPTSHFTLLTSNFPPHKPHPCPSVKSVVPNPSPNKPLSLLTSLPPPPSPHKPHPRPSVKSVVPNPTPPALSQQAPLTSHFPPTSLTLSDPACPNTPFKLLTSHFSLPPHPSIIAAREALAKTPPAPLNRILDQIKMAEASWTNHPSGHGSKQKAAHQMIPISFLKMG